MAFVSTQDETSIPSPFQICTWVYFCGSVLASLILGLTFLSGLSMQLSERIELLLAPVLLVLSSSFALIVAKRKLKLPQIVWTLSPILALVTLVIQLLVVATPRPYYFDDLTKFNLTAVIFAILGGAVATPLVTAGLERLSRIAKREPWIAVTGWIFLILFTLSLFVYSSKYWGWSVRLGDSLVALEEYAAAASGLMPASTFISQYQNLLGLPLYLLSFYQDISLTGLLTYLLILQILTLVLAVVTLYKTVDPSWIWFSLIIFFGLLLLGTYSGHTVLDVWSVIPGRLLLPFLLIAVASFLFVSLAIGSVWASRLWLGITGALISFVSINNLDFGLPLCLAFSATLFLNLILSHRMKLMAFYLLGLVLALLAYVIFLAPLGEGLDLRLIISFVFDFQSNSSWSISMPPVGLHLAYLLISISASVWALVLLIRRNSKKPMIWIVLLIGVFNTLGYAYFAGRSHLGNLAALNPSLALLLACWLPNLARGTRPLRDKQLISRGRLLETSTVGALCGLGLAAAVFGVAPNYTNFGGTPSGYSYTRYVNTPGLKGWLNLVWLCGWDDKICWWAETEKGEWNETALDKNLLFLTSQLDVGNNRSEITISGPLANLTSLAVFQRGTQVVSDPRYFSRFPRVSQLQCRLYEKRSIKVVVGSPSHCDVTSEGLDLRVQSPLR